MFKDKLNTLFGFFDIIFLSNSGFGDAREDLSEIVYSYFYRDDENKTTENVEMDKGYI
jgi:hypothetical protein